jgi:hypothetical protein
VCGSGQGIGDGRTCYNPITGQDRRIAHDFCSHVFAFHKNHLVGRFLFFVAYPGYCLCFILDFRRRAGECVIIGKNSFKKGHIAVDLRLFEVSVEFKYFLFGLALCKC